MNFDDETLMAYADGELDAAQRAAIAAAMEKDSGLARRVEKYRALREEIAGAFGGVLDQPVPERLIAAANGGGAPSEARAARRGKILQFPAKAGRAPGPARSMREWSAIAASVALAIFVSWRVFVPTEQNLIVASGGALVARGELAIALDEQLASDQRREEPVQIGVTFKSREGNYCRSFTLPAAQTAGLACRADGDWQIASTAAAQIPAGQVQQAAGAMPAAVLSAIEARIAGEALDAAGEENARLGGWSVSGGT